MDNSQQPIGDNFEQKVDGFAPPLVAQQPAYHDPPQVIAEEKPYENIPIQPNTSIQQEPPLIQQPMIQQPMLQPQLQQNTVPQMASYQNSPAPDGYNSGYKPIRKPNEDMSQTVLIFIILEIVVCFLPFFHFIAVVVGLVVHFWIKSSTVHEKTMKYNQVLLGCTLVNCVFLVLFFVIIILFPITFPIIGLGITIIFMILGFVPFLLLLPCICICICIGLCTTAAPHTST